MRMSSARKQKCVGCLVFLLALMLGIFGGSLFFSVQSSKFSTAEELAENLNYFRPEPPRVNRVTKIFEKQTTTSIEDSELLKNVGELDMEGSRMRPSAGDSGTFRIPNLVHYIILSKDTHPLDFTEYLSILSAYKYQDPDEIWIHCNQDPFGHWWDELIQNVSWHKLRVVHMDIPQHIGVNAIPTLSHAIDIAKMDVLYKYGGIYMDTDVIFVHSVNPLRIYPCVMGQEAEMKLSPALVMAEANATFLELLLQLYIKDFKPNHVDYNNGILPYKLAQKNPDLVYIESANLIAPSLSKKHLLFTDNTELIEWRHLYAIHLMFHQGVNRIYNPSYIIPLKNLVGRLFRRVYYGSAAELDPYLEQVKGREKYNLQNKLLNTVTQ